MWVPCLSDLLRAEEQLIQQISSILKNSIFCHWLLSTVKLFTTHRTFTKLHIFSWDPPHIWMVLVPLLWPSYDPALYSAIKTVCLQNFLQGLSLLPALGVILPAPPVDESKPRRKQPQRVNRRDLGWSHPCLAQLLTPEEGRSSALWALQSQGAVCEHTGCDCTTHLCGDERWHCSSSSVPSDAFTGEHFSSGAIPHLVPPCQRWWHRPKAVQVTMIWYHLCTSTSTLQPLPQTPKTDPSQKEDWKSDPWKYIQRDCPISVLQRSQQQINHISPWAPSHQMHNHLNPCLYI